MLAILWAGMIFDESLGSTQWLGVGLVLIGLLVFNLSKNSTKLTNSPSA